MMTTSSVFTAEVSSKHAPCLASGSPVASGVNGYWSCCQQIVAMTKPGITTMVVLTVWIGYLMGASTVEGQKPEVGWALLVAALVGCGLSCMGASVLNQVWEQDTDALMRRTLRRPLAAGWMTTPWAMVYGLILSAGGLGILAYGTNGLTTVLSTFTIVSYVLVYTPMKRVNSTSTIVGAVPGALPPVMGYTAATGRVDAAAWVMFAILFLWQLPHFLSIAWVYRDEYDRAGLVVLPVEDRDGDSTFRQILLGCLALLPLGLVPTVLGLSGMVYFYGALLAGAVMLALGVTVSVTRRHRDARALFYASLAYLPVVFGLMAWDRR